MEESAAPSRPPDPGPVDADPGDADRLELLEQQVRQLTSRLAAWVETQLGRAVDDRHQESQMLRSDLQALLDARLAGVRSEIASMLTVVDDRIEAGQEELRSRLEAVGQRGPEGRAPAGADLEQRVREAMSRLTESVEARLAELARTREADARAVRRELTAELDERLLDAGSRTGAGLAGVQDRLAQQATTVAQRVEEVARQATTAAEAVAAVAADAAAATARTEAFEQRVKSAMGRLTDTVETRLAEAATARQVELDRLRDELGGRMEAVGAGRAGEAVVAGQAAARTAERTDALEMQLKAALARTTARLDAKVAEVTEASKADGVAIRAELRATLAQHAAELRAETGAVADAARTALGRAQARLEALEEHDRRVGDRIASVVEARVAEVLGAVAAQAGSVAESVQALGSSVAADGARLEALELHTRRTDAKLTELVEEKLAELAADRGVELTKFQDELEGAVATKVGQLQVEVSSALEATRHELAESTARLAAQRAEMEAVLAAQVAELDTVREAARTELVAGAVRLHEQRTESTAAVDERMAAAEVELGAALEAAGEELSARLEVARAELAGGAADLEAQQAALAARAEELAVALDAQAQLASVVESLGRKVDRAQERGRDRLKALSQRLDEATAAMAAASKKEAGALAPLRSDVRMLQSEVAALAETVGSLARRKAPAKAPPAPRIPALKAEARRRALRPDQ